MNNMVTIARQEITSSGGSLYVLIPKFLREVWSPKSGDTIIFMRESDDAPIMIRLEKGVDA